MFKILLFTALVVITTQSALATELREFTLQKFESVSTVTSPNGCTKKVDGFLGSKRKKSIDCFGVFLGQVSGVDNLGNPVQIGNILLFPSGESRSEAENVTEMLIAVIKGQTPNGTTITLSNVRYIDKNVELSLISKDASDTTMVKLGGVTLHIHSVTVDGNATLTQDNNVSVGLN